MLTTDRSDAIKNFLGETTKLFVDLSPDGYGLLDASESRLLFAEEYPNSTLLGYDDAELYIIGLYGNEEEETPLLIVVLGNNIEVFGTERGSSGLRAYGTLV